MALLNIAAILLLRKGAYMLLNDFESQLKEGKKPKFNSLDHKGYEHLTIWHKK